MSRAACVVALVWLAGCASTTDHYAGSDLSLASEPQPAGAPAEQPEPTPAGRVAIPVVPALDAGSLPAPPDAAQAPAPTVCAAGTADCDADPRNGCEVDLLRAAAHCGACGNACATASCACEDGRFVAACATGQADCDGNAQNGCEIDTSSDAQHCGGCAQVCHADGHDALAAACTAGRCELTCRSALEIDCDGDPDNGCEAYLWIDPENCGGCGVQCDCHDGRCR
jgi:hypothetical protein